MILTTVVILLSLFLFRFLLFFMIIDKKSEIVYYGWIKLYWSDDPNYQVNRLKELGVKGKIKEKI